LDILKHKETNFLAIQASCARAQSAQQVQITLAVYRAEPNHCCGHSCFHKINDCFTRDRKRDMKLIDDPVLCEYSICSALFEVEARISHLVPSGL
jgi:hypothetical protein